MVMVKERADEQSMTAAFVPNMLDLAEDLLFSDIGERKALSPRDHSLITISNLITSGNTEQLVYYLNQAMDNGISEDELKEIFVHLAYYAGWPKLLAALKAAYEVFTSKHESTQN